jgi:hypothetical protein
VQVRGYNEVLVLDDKQALGLALDDKQALGLGQDGNY